MKGNLAKMKKKKIKPLLSFHSHLILFDSNKKKTNNNNTSKRSRYIIFSNQQESPPLVIRIETTKEINNLVFCLVVCLF
jgi:hypothetical protein